MHFLTLKGHLSTTLEVRDMYVHLLGNGRRSCGEGSLGILDFETLD